MLYVREPMTRLAAGVLCWGNEGDVWSVDLTDGTQRPVLLGREARWPQYSPFETTIMYATGPAGAGRTTALQVTNADGSATRTIERQRAFGDAPSFEEYDWFKKPPPDTDRDGIDDASDACPRVPGRFSANGCPDGDRDGVADGSDACPHVAAATPNGCPEAPPGPIVEEFDADGVIDADDNCYATPNATQADRDRDGLGDPCDQNVDRPSNARTFDADRDGIANSVDRCIHLPGSAPSGCPSDLLEGIERARKLGERATLFGEAAAAAKLGAIGCATTALAGLGAPELLAAAGIEASASVSLSGLLAAARFAAPGAVASFFGFGDVRRAKKFIDAARARNLLKAFSTAVSWSVGGCAKGLVGVASSVVELLRDPPDTNFSEIASARPLPDSPEPCRLFPSGRPRRACRHWKRAASSYRRATGEVAAVLAARAVTANRLAAAQRAAGHGSRSVVRVPAEVLQRAVMKTYSGQLARALERQHGAGLKFARFIKARRLDSRLPARQVEIVRQEMAFGALPPGSTGAMLTRRVTSAEDLSSVMANSADRVGDAPIDLRTELARRVDTRPLARRYRSMRILDVSVIESALAQSAVISPDADRALRADLQRAAMACTARRRALAASRLLVDIRRHVHGSWSRFLADAARPLLGQRAREPLATC